ncbi:MAG: hypothetical protein WCB79_09045, partial [Halobacteriota archaeon]
SLLQVTYSGIPLEGESRLGKELSYANLMKIEEGDLVISRIAACYGSVALITKNLTHLLVSSEFIILRIRDKRYDPWFLWGFLRSSEVRARLLSEATGLNRHRIQWEDIKTIPVPLIADLQKLVSNKYQEFFEARKRAEENKEAADALLNTRLHTDNEWAVRRLKVAKPPR